MSSNFYVIHHKASCTFFGNHHPESVRSRVCCFPNHNHATRVANNIARFYIAQNTLPDVSDPNQYNPLFYADAELIYDNNFAPLGIGVTADTMNIDVVALSKDKLLEYCEGANADMTFCIISRFDQPNEKVYLFEIDTTTTEALASPGEDDSFLDV